MFKSRTESRDAARQSAGWFTEVRRLSEVPVNGIRHPVSLTLGKLRRGIPDSREGQRKLFLEK